MICFSCTRAGDFTSGQDGTPIEAGRGLAYAYELAAKMHASCSGCPCQHRIREIKPTLPDPFIGGAV